jgi:hypothetical protein
VRERPIPPSADAAAIAATIGGSLPDDGADPTDVVELLASAVERDLFHHGGGDARDQTAETRSPRACG